MKEFVQYSLKRKKRKKRISSFTFLKLKKKGSKKTLLKLKLKKILLKLKFKKTKGALKYKKKMRKKSLVKTKLRKKKKPIKRALVHTKVKKKITKTRLVKSLFLKKKQKQFKVLQKKVKNFNFLEKKNAFLYQLLKVKKIDPVSLHLNKTLMETNIQTKTAFYHLIKLSQVLKFGFVPKNSLDVLAFFFQESFLLASFVEKTKREVSLHLQRKPFFFLPKRKLKKKLLEQENKRKEKELLQKPKHNRDVKNLPFNRSHGKKRKEVFSTKEKKVSQTTKVGRAIVNSFNVKVKGYLRKKKERNDKNSSSPKKRADSKKTETKRKESKRK